LESNIVKYLMLALVLAFCAQPMLYAQDCIRVGISMSKQQYLRDELLDAVVTLENHRSSAQGIALRYPLISLAFTPLASLRRSQNLLPDTGGIFTVTSILPGQKLTVRIYLERFLDGFQPGHHEIPWTLSVACSEPNRMNFTGFASAGGLLRFDISYASINPSSSTFETYFQRLYGHTDLRLQGQTDSQEPFFRAAAVEALIVSP
jgi:hypothetical protein